MAATISVKDRLKLSNAFATVTDVTFDSSYVTGGLAVDPGSLGLESVALLQASNSGGYAFEYDYTNKKLKAYRADYDAVADGPLVEVPATTNLSAVTTKVISFGR